MSISGPRRRLLGVRLLPQDGDQLLDALTMMKFAFPILLKSSPVAISL